MSDAKDVKFSLKVVTNKLQTKVLFAEADSGFIDVLISFLTLPLGTIVSVLKKHYGEEAPVNIGSLTSLYNGLANLDKAHFWTGGCKEVLLVPRSSFAAECLNLKLDISETQPTEYFTCKSQNCVGNRTKISCVSVYYDNIKCYCGKTMTREAGEKVAKAADGGAFTANTDSFIISDDLRMFPSTKGFVQIFSILGITDTDVGEQTTVTFGFNEIMHLLNGSLFSQTPLSDIILNKRQVDNFEQGILFHEVDKEMASNNSSKVALKVILQKSTNKMLFAQAQEDFVDYLFGLMVIPLGEVQCLLGSNSCFKSIGNLYRSIVDFMDDKSLATPLMKNRLMKPKLLHGYISGNLILPLSEESVSHTHNIHSTCSTYPVSLYSANFVKGRGKFVRGPRMYKITDDLTVTPFCMASTISTLKGLKIPMSDVKELELEIGLQEGLSILRASLTSTSALTNGLQINRMLTKQPKQEK